MDSGQYSFISYAKGYEKWTYSDKGLVNDIVDRDFKGEFTVNEDTKVTDVGREEILYL